MVRATPDDGEAAAVVVLHVEDLDGVGPERRHEVPAALEAQRDGRRPERPAEPGPVEGAVERGVVDADAAAGVDDADREAGGGGPAGGPLAVAGDEPGVGRCVVVVGEAVEVEAHEAQVRAAGQRLEGGGDVAFVDPELRRAAGHGQRRHRERTGQVDPQGDRQRRPEAGGDVLRPAQLVEALDVDGDDPAVLGRGPQRGVGLPRPAEDDRRVRRRRPHQLQFPGRADVEAGHDPRQRGEDRRFGVGLDGVEQLAPGGQRRHRRRGVGPEAGEVVDVGADRPVVLRPEPGDNGGLVSPHRRAPGGCAPAAAAARRRAAGGAS